MPNPEHIIEQIRNATDIVEIISSYLPLKKQGREFSVCCPFHNEKTPSFTVVPHKQIFYCFGCHKGGDVFKFLCEYENIDSFKELTWVHVTGTIQKGYLDGDIPILKVIDLKETSKPKDEYVYPPDDTYIPTSILY